MAISINNVHKTYKGHRTEQVNALRGVSFTLPEKGLVFILGKSGCGKSTLLNVLGGLDGFDSGDIIVDGKSMKDFTAKDYDNYRNNYVGFVFQENNLLEQYTVKRNVGLALELQSQKGVDEKIAEALEQVDLKDFGERRCNRLSGGQKQRVAIARALIKNPEMLLCDEPTGSLDSDTGKEIFDLLKKISESTLVVVVSHDRESAEKYGDRVIEIKDGSVLSDNKPEEVKATEQKQKEQKKNGLPIKQALAMGAGFLVARPIRFALCILICLITFTCMGISDAFTSYDMNKAIAENMKLYKTSHLSYTKNVCYYEGKEFDAFNNEQMSKEDCSLLKTLVKSSRLDNYYDISYMLESNNDIFYFDQLPYNESSKSLKWFGYSGFAEMDENFAKDYGFTLYGDYPKANDEVVLTWHFYKGFVKFGYDGNTPITKWEDLIGKTISLKEQLELKVVGILDTKVNEEIYGEMLYGDSYNENLVNGLYTFTDKCAHNAIFCNVGFHDEVFLPKALELNVGTLSAENTKDIISVFSPNDGNSKTLLYNIKVYERYQLPRSMYEDDDSFIAFNITNDVTRNILSAGGDMELFRLIFMYVSAGMIVISVLFMLYYTEGTISEKKREMGILRALGASRGDIFKIFGIENGLFGIVLIVLATILSAVGLIIINSYITAELSLFAALVSFGIRQFAVLAAVAIGAIAVGIAIPIFKLLRAKPVDIIAGRK